jgi:hypothetical protein
MDTRVKVIFPEFGGSDREHFGKLGVMVEHNPNDGHALVVFDGDSSPVRIAACCLQEQA